MLLQTLFAFSMSGLSGYMPLNQSPNLERHVNQILINAEMGVVKRPVAINYLHVAFNKVCLNAGASSDLSSDLKSDLSSGKTNSTISSRSKSVLNSCAEVSQYLNKTKSSLYINHASANVAVNNHTNLDSRQPITSIKNQRGESSESNFSGQGQAVWNVNNFVAFNGGFKTYKDINNEQAVTVEDTYVSFGVDYAQFDIGYKAHWFSPFKQSAMIMSTHAPTFANVSLSNSMPLTDWNLNYELFVGEMSQSSKIRYEGALIDGKPLLAGFHLSFMPFDGFTLGFNRVMQSGGGERGNRGIVDLIKAFFDPSGADNTTIDLNSDEEVGNQAASLTSRFDFSGDSPFSIYLEFAGEDTSRGSNYRLGNTSLSFGVDIPVIWHNFDINYEYSQWQRLWYVHHVYQDGLQNDGSFIGHWVAEMRQRYNNIGGHAVGSTHHILNIGYQIDVGNRIETQISQTKNDPLSNVSYETAQQLEVTWFTDRFNSLLQTQTLSVHAYAGKNTLGEKHSGLNLAVYW